MSLRNLNKGKTPLGPPLSGGKQELTVQPSSEDGALTAPPLSRGGREGLLINQFLGFIQLRIKIVVVIFNGKFH